MKSPTLHCCGTAAAKTTPIGVTIRDDLFARFQLSELCRRGCHKEGTKELGTVSLLDEEVSGVTDIVPQGGAARGMNLDRKWPLQH